MTYPPWVVLHVPHDSTTVPAAVRPQFLLDDTELGRELDRMTDHRTLAIFADPSSDAAVVRSPVSRLVVDVERFPDDADEPMAARGMGAVYTATSQLTSLRRRPSAEEREALMQAYYRQHHARLEAAVATALERHDRCLVIDCHSFPSVALPCEMADPANARPDICVGTDDFHNSAALAGAFTVAFRRAGWRVSLNEPFRGSVGTGQSVPARRTRRCRDGRSEPPALPARGRRDALGGFRGHRSADQRVLRRGDYLVEFIEGAIRGQRWAGAIASFPVRVAGTAGQCPGRAADGTTSDLFRV